jgi:hypothetical protein
VGRRDAVVTAAQEIGRPPLRLPPGWVALGPGLAALPAGDGERPAAVVSVTPGPGADLDGLRATPGLLVLDEHETHCRGGVPAHRLLTTHRQGDRSLTTEVWTVAGAAPAVLCAAVDTARYADLGPLVRRVLRSYRP